MTRSLVRSSRRWRLVVAAAAGLASFGCSNFNDLVEVNPADRVAEGVVFNDPNQAGLLARSVQSQFECAQSSSTVALGLLGGEINSLGNTGMFSLDARRPDKAGGFNGQYAVLDCGQASVGIYVPMSSARWFADKVLTTLQGWTDAQVPNRNALIAEVAAYAGYSYLMLGEGFCSMAIDAGPELTPAQVFALAEEKFGVAITAAQAAGASAANYLNLALVGRARTRLDLANPSGAAADAQGVPASFVYNVTRDANSPFRVNGFYFHINANVSAGLAPEYFDVRWNGKPDPRVPAVDQGPTTTNVERVTTTKYAAATSPIPLATGAEAQLILAEVQGGQAAVDIITALHAAVGLDPFVSNDPTEIHDQIVEERRRQFFLDGHRNYDRIRFNIPLDPPSGSPYRWGGLFSDAKCLPLPDIETINNPNFH